jgi:hypothetical protein
MAHMNYGCMHPSPKTTEYPVAASQYFAHNGPNLVYLDGSGNVTKALTSATTTIFGIAVIPTGRGNPTNTSDVYWMSSATAAEDRVPVIKVDSNYNFLLLSNGTPTASQAGDACDVLAVNDANPDYVAVATSTTDVMIIQGRGVDFDNRATTADVVVKLNRTKRQSD